MNRLKLIQQISYRYRNGFMNEMHKKFCTNVSPNLKWLQTYEQYLVKYPLATKSITSGLLAFFADIICQKILELKESNGKKITYQLDLKRSGIFTALGTLYTGPILHFWYGFLMTKMPGFSMPSVLQRLFFDQAFFAPTFIAGFFSISLLLDDKSKQIPDKFQNDLLPTTLANYFLWVPAQFVNFKYIPPHYQVLFANTVGFFWNIYLSYCTNKKVE